MSNLINQQVAFDLLMSRARELTGITGDLGGACVGAAKLIKKLPSTELKTGKWRPNHISGSILYECDQCGYDCGAYSFNFCPMCGADMRGEKE